MKIWWLIIIVLIFLYLRCVGYEYCQCQDALRLPNHPLGASYNV